MTVGAGAFTYEAVPDWPRLPEELEVRDGVGVGIDSAGRVIVFVRGSLAVLILEADGAYSDGWGAARFVRPHGLCVAPDDTLYLTDDLAHSVGQYTQAGDLIRTIGPAGMPSETGIVGGDYRMIRPGVGPFNQPTNVAIGANGDIYVSDGYGNARVHRFAAGGDRIASWGEPGAGRGHFNVPHGIACGPDGRLYVSDRENSRVQVFDADGTLLAIWDDLVRPTQAAVDGEGNVYVAELGRRAGVYPFDEEDPDGQGGRVSIFDASGSLLARWGTGADPSSAEDFYAPHGIAVDADGSIYTTEVVTTARSALGDASAAFPPLRKFRRVDR